MKIFTKIKQYTWLSKLICLPLLLVLGLLGGSLTQKGLDNIALLYFMRSLVKPIPSQLSHNLERMQTLLNASQDENDERYTAYLARLAGLDQMLNGYPYANLANGRKALEQAQVSLANGDFKASREFLQQAMDTGIDMIQLEAHLWLAKLQAAQGDSVGYDQQMESATNTISKNQVQTDACPDWRLKGVFVDTGDLVLNQPVHLWLSWQRPPNQTNDIQDMGTPMPGTDGAWRIWTWHDYVFQLGVEPNKIFDGGFEQIALPYQGFPRQLPFVLHGQERRYSAVVYAEPDISQNMTLLLNGHGEEAVGVSTRPIAFPADTSGIAYLVTGRFRSDETAVPRIGIRWMLTGARSFGDNVSTYVVSKPNPYWVSYAGLFVPPNEAESLEYWVVNEDRATDLQVDDLGLWPIPLPCASIRK